MTADAMFPTPTTPPLLEVRGLTVTYVSGGQEVHAVRGIDFTLGAGQSLGVAGESGSGKSTVALSLLKLLPPETRVGGEVLFEGEDLLQARPGRLRAVRWAGASVVFQGAMSALNPVRTIGEQIREPILLHGSTLSVSGGSVDRDGGGEHGGRAGSRSPAALRAARARTAELLDSVGIPARRQSAYPHELSGGQRQRVMIAMALACHPNLVIADEPTTALDVIVQSQILALLTDLVRESHIGMIMISHDLSVLADTCERLAVMYAGNFVEIGPGTEVVRHSRHPYSRALSGAFPRIGDPASRRAPRGLGGDPPDARAVGAGCPFEPRCPESFADCRTHPVRLWPAPDAAHESACLKVLPEFAGTRGAGWPA